MTSGEFTASVGVAEPGLTVSAVARRLGVAPATLRTWDRRYCLGPSQHAAGAHRRYSALDVARLERMRRLVLSGVPPAGPRVWCRRKTISERNVLLSVRRRGREAVTSSLCRVGLLTLGVWLVPHSLSMRTHAGAFWPTRSIAADSCGPGTIS